MFKEILQDRRAKRLALVVPASLALAAMAAACGGGDDDDAPTATATTAPQATATTSSGSPSTPSGDEIEIELTDNVFTPSEITVPVNTAVQIKVENKGLAVHNMHVLSKDQEGKDFTSDALVNPGKSSTFEVKFTKTGKVNFQCDFHLPAMAGVITVQ